MFIDLRTPGLRLPSGRAHTVLQRVRNGFPALASEVARVLVHVRPATGADAAALRDCTVEVHLRDGAVEVVHERRRRLLAVLGRALQRAWESTQRRLARPVARAAGAAPHFGQSNSSSPAAPHQASVARPSVAPRDVRSASQ